MPMVKDMQGKCPNILMINKFTVHDPDGSLVFDRVHVYVGLP